MKNKFDAFLLSVIGWHYFYLGKIPMQFAFWFTGGGFMLWWIIDIIRFAAMSEEDFDERYGNGEVASERRVNNVRELKTYGEMYKQGLLTEEEFTNVKNVLLPRQEY